MTRPDALVLSPEEIDRRFAWARHRGHPRYLWPDVPIVAWRRAMNALADATACLLETPARECALTAEDPRAIGVAAYTSGMGPWLGLQVERGALETAEPVRDLLAVHLAHGRGRARRRAEVAQTVIAALVNENVRPVALKGLHTAHACFPEPGTRIGADIDLLVAADDAETATRVMHGLGYRPDTILANPSRVEWVPPHERRLNSLDVHHEADAIAVDVHESLTRIFFGVRDVALDTVPWTASPFPVLGDGARVLDHPHHLVFLLLHTSEDWKHLQLAKLLEIVLTVRTDTGHGTLEWPAVTDLLDGLRAWRFVYPAMALVERLAPGTIDPHALRRAASDAPARMKRVVSSTRWEDLQQLHRVSLSTRFMWTRTPAEVLRTAAALAWPPRTTAEPLPRVLAERMFRLVRGTLTFRDR